jgi:hypothetical protein
MSNFLSTISICFKTSLMDGPAIVAQGFRPSQSDMRTTSNVEGTGREGSS